MAAYRARLKEFNNELSEDHIDISKLQELCFSGIPDDNGCRPLCWKLLLNYLSCDRSTWNNTLTTQRQLYDQFINEMIVNPLKQENSIAEDVTDHPLNPNPKSQWQTFFKDNEVLLQIDKDVRRLCPDISFFQSASSFPCIKITQDPTLESLHKRVQQESLKYANVTRNRIGITNISLSVKKATEEYIPLAEGQEAHWEVVERILFIYAKLNPGQGYVQLVDIRRIAIAKDSFNKMKPILTNRNISLTTKNRVLKAYVWSTLLYGCECWTINKVLKKKLEATEMWFLRRMLKISWKEKKTNEFVLENAGTKRSLIKTIRKRQMQFLGHLNRHKGLEHLALTGKIDGKRGPGRKRFIYLESLNCWMTKKEKSNVDFLRISEKRVEWRTMITDGMNEIIGPIYYTFASNPDSEWRKYAEADSFFCFTNVMSEIRDFFIKTLDESSTGIGGMMAKLMNSLQKYDNTVFWRLKQQDLKPQFFAFRWITLLLSQEFPLPGNAFSFFPDCSSVTLKYSILLLIVCHVQVTRSEHLWFYIYNMKLNQRMNQSAVMRVGGNTSDKCTLGRGVRQGCLMSPVLFNIYGEAMIQDALHEMDVGVSIGGRSVKAVRFADDTALVASSVSDLQMMMDKLNAIVEL
ncbi:TBC1 domain family member 13 [Nymphon striatum]|nr:TBC1 domain family member 13 [Nymphon striatum]